MELTSPLGMTNVCNFTVFFFKATYLLNHGEFFFCPFCNYLNQTTMENNSKPNFTEEDTNRIITDLLDESYIQDGKQKLACGAVGEVAKKFKMTEQNVRRIWRILLIKREEEGT